MFGRFFQRDAWLEAGERARLRHGGWLTRAVRRPIGALPRIPLRRVSDGGFAVLTRSPEGRAWADRWWESAWARMDDES